MPTHLRSAWDRLPPDTTRIYESMVYKSLESKHLQTTDCQCHSFWIFKNLYSTSLIEKSLNAPPIVKIFTSWHNMQTVSLDEVDFEHTQNHGPANRLSFWTFKKFNKYPQQKAFFGEAPIAHSTDFHQLALDIQRPCRSPKKIWSATKWWLCQSHEAGSWGTAGMTGC